MEVTDQVNFCFLTTSGKTVYDPILFYILFFQVCGMTISPKSENMIRIYTLAVDISRTKVISIVLLLALCKFFDIESGFCSNHQNLSYVLTYKGFICEYSKES